MATLTLGGNQIKTSGNLPKVGSKAIDFNLVSIDLTSKTLSDFKDKTLILNIFPSVDTGICSTSVKTFNKAASSMKDIKVLCISRDLPFRQDQFCAAEGLKDVIMLSDFKSGAFGTAYGLIMTTGIFDGLLSRCVIVINKDGEIAYTQQVSEIGHEPNYNDVLNFVNFINK